MKTIVLDMEWTDTCTGGKYPQNSGKDILHNEVIQIGAVCIHETGTSIETGETFIVNVCPVAVSYTHLDCLYGAFLRTCFFQRLQIP